MANNWKEWYEIEVEDWEDVNERLRLKEEHEYDEADRLWSEEKALYKWPYNEPSQLPR